MGENKTGDNGEKSERTEDIDGLKNLTINDNSEILVSMSIDGECIFRRLGITKDEAIGILRAIEYGRIGDEKYNILFVESVKNVK